MINQFDIFCNNCGQGIALRPFQEYATCSKCRTRLKIEETEKTIETIVISESEFIRINPTPIPFYENKHVENLYQLKEYESELQDLDTDWNKQLEGFKIKNGKNKILPRRNQSIILTLLGLIALFYTIINKGKKDFISTIGVILIFTSGKELYKWWKYQNALKEYEAERERLESIIERLK